jgi:hypothetical protein
MCVCMVAGLPAGPIQPITPKFGMGSSFHPGSAPSQGAAWNVGPQPCPWPHPMPPLLLLLSSLDQIKCSWYLLVSLTPSVNYQKTYNELQRCYYLLFVIQSNSIGAIQIICDTFLALFRPPTPCDVWWHFSRPPPPPHLVWRDTFQNGKLWP